MPRYHKKVTPEDVEEYHASRKLLNKLGEELERREKAQCTFCSEPAEYVIDGYAVCERHHPDPYH